MEQFLHKGYNFFIKGFKSVLFVVMFCLMGVMGKGQVVFLSENIGSGSGITSISSYTGWQNNGVLTFTGTGDVRSTSASSGYSGASGTGNVFITNIVGTKFEISNINTIGFNSISISFGALKTTTASDMSELILEYSVDGSSYTTLSIPAQPTGAGTAIWRLITISSGIPNTSNLHLRWTNTSATPQFRLDDISLSGIATSNTISITSLSNNNFSLSNCSSTASVDVNFNSTGTFSAGNNFTAQLSDGSGSFTTPINIGSINLNGTNPTATISSTIPAGALTGSNFRIRVVSDNPSVSSTLSSAINVTQSGYCGTNSTDYFRSRSTGNWNSPSTWESSPNSSFSPLITATQSPTSTANTITIRNTHNVTLSANASADQLIIEQGGVLTHNNSVTFTLNNDPSGTDMIINGTYVIYGPVPLGTGTYTVESTGIIRANGNAGGTADNIARNTNSLVLFKTGSVFEWNTTLAFNTDNITYFPNNSEKPIFRITAAVGSLGANSTTIFNGLFEVNGSIILDNSGTKYFRDGISGTGTITQTAASGPLVINGSSAILGGSGIIVLNTNGLQVAGSSRVDLISNKTINGSTFDFTVSNGGQLNCSTFVVSGTSDFVLASGGTLGIGSSDGITSSGAIGNTQTSTRYYSSGGNYLYNGTTAQSTGDFTTSPTVNTVNTLTIANTGAPTNVTTLTNNNLTVSNLYLSSGLFAAGAGQNLNIASGGSIYGNGGHNIEDISAGNIVFLGPGTTYGNAPNNPRLYSVIIGNGGVIGVDFKGGPSTNSAALIMKSLQINGGGFVTNAPFYKTGFSSLIYNIDFNIYGAYARNVEWGNTVGLQGYPHHVIVQGNTILDLNTNSISAPQLATGGDLIIGNATGRGQVYMNNFMSKALSVGGNLTIGSLDPVSSGSILWLSNSMGGDLWLYGSFSRYSNSFYTDNSRAIFFKGSVPNVTINTPDINTPGVPSQYFSYVLLEKTAGTETITLNCAVGINNAITFTGGIITSSTNNLLVISNAATSTIGSTSSFVNGPMRKLGNQLFTFPVGKIVGSEYHHRIIGISAPSNPIDEFTAEFKRESATALGPINSPGAPPLQWVSRCEYWILDRTKGTSNVNVTLSWSSQSACNLTYVTDLPTLVIAHFNGSIWNKHGADSRSGDETNGTVTWNAVTDYSPFSLGTIDVRENYLPFNLSSFTARSRKSDIQVDWNVMNNNDQEEYILEHSKDGIQFTTLRVVKAKVILNQAAYTELDQTPYNGWNYYRLRAKDKLDREKVSQVVKVWFGFADVIRISPNPASEKININLAEPSSINQIQVVNSTGQVLKQVNNIQFSNEINISELAAGIYYLRLTGKNGLAIKSFVKN